MIVVAVNYLDAANVAGVALFCDDPRGFTTKPTDTPANTTAVPKLRRAGSFRREMFAGNAPAGAVRVGYGNVEIDNTGRLFDDWGGYAVDGRAVLFYMGERGAAFPAGFTLLGTATAERCELDRTTLRVILRDGLADYDKPICPLVYAGTGGVEGTAAMGGRRKPKGYGAVFNAAPVLVDPALLIYQMSSSYETSTTDQYVRDGGAVLSNGAVYSSLVDMQTNAPTAGQVRHWPAGGCFRLGSSSVLEITADRKFHDATTSVSSKIIERMALDAGTLAGDILTVASLGLTAGIYFAGDETTFLQGMTRIAEGAGLWFGRTRAGKLTVGQLTDPVSGTSVATFLRHQLKDLSRVPPPGMPVPVQRVRLRYHRNNRPLSTFAGSISLADRDLLAREWREVESANAGTATRHPYAPDFVRDTYGCDLFGSSAPSAELARVLALFSADRSVYPVSIELTEENAAACDLGDVVTLQTAEFGLSAGKKLAVVSHEVDLDAHRINLGLWG